MIASSPSILFLIFLWIQLSLVLSIENASESRMAPNGLMHMPMQMPMQLGNLYNPPQRVQPFKHLPFDPMMMGPNVLANSLVPIAVSFSVGFLLFKLLAMGMFMLEKELALPYSHWKMDSNFNPIQFGRVALNSPALMQLLERVYKALDKYGGVVKQK